MSRGKKREDANSIDIDKYAINEIRRDESNATSTMIQQVDGVKVLHRAQVEFEEGS